ncbi:hypothetical protein [Primorskyibacter marinus]|nr:hypothetical protein [Primorskyibacter marinus]
MNKRMGRGAETALGPQERATAMVRHTYAKSAGNAAMLAQNT